MVEPPTINEVIKVKQESLTVIWLVMTASIGVCAMVVSVATNGDLPGHITVLKGSTFTIAAAAIAALSILLPQRMISPKAIVDHLRSEPELRLLSMRRGQVDLEQLRMWSALEKPQQRIASLVVLFRKPFIVALACSELLALLGLVLGLSSHNLFAGLSLLTAALGLNLWHYPRLMPLIERGKKLQPDEVLDALAKDLKTMERDLNVRRRRPSRPKPGAT